MSDNNNELKEAARNFAKAAADRGAEVAEKVVDATKKAAIKTYESARDFTADAADKTKAFAQRAGLRADNREARSQLRREFETLGRIYFEAYGEDPVPEVADSCRAVSIILGAIERNNGEIAEIDRLLKEKK